MILHSVRARTNNLLVYAAVITTLAVTPWFSFDPINPIKMFTLALFSLVAVFTLLPSLREGLRGVNRIPILITILFLIHLTLVLLIDDSPRLQQFFGTFGRNTGYVSYFALALLFISAVMAMNLSGAKKLLYGLMFTGVINVGYGVIQFLGADPIDWANPYNRTIGTLGNPNFASSFLGMTAILAISWSFGSSLKTWMRFLNFLVAGIALFLCLKSNSIQGIAIALIGFFLIGHQVLVKTLNWRKAAIPYLLAGLVGFITALMGALQKGPLTSILYQDSVTYRGDYWRAGIAMTKDSPVFGIGLDSFGDYYRAYRSIEAVNRRGPDVTSNSAHNVFLDISSTGGLPLLFLYIVLILLGLRSGFRLLSRSEKYEWIPIALVSTWFAYLAQSAISINQLGLAVWGWIIPGTIIALDNDSMSIESQKLRAPIKRTEIPATNFISSAIGLVIAVTISIWPFTYDLNFRSAITKGTSELILQRTLSFPATNNHIMFVAKAFSDNKLGEETYLLLQKATSNNPRDFSAIDALARDVRTSPADREQLESRLKEIDPLNPSLRDR